MPKKTLRELQKSKFLTVINEDKGIIDKIVSPNNFQVGADSSLLPSSLSVYGRIIAGQGLSGSLTTLIDGTSYLIAGTNITISSESNGAVTISSVGAVAGAGGSNTQVQFNNDGSLDGSSSFIFDNDTDSLKVTNLSGSLTRLTDGTSYLIAGTNITIVTQSNGSVVINSSGGGGSITATSGSSSVENITEIIFDDGLFVVDNGDNTVTITSTIGEAEDGTYADGLYTDFTPNTSIGIAIDRFNEILKLLAPAPAPTLDDLSVDVDGIDTYLSFGSSNNLEGEATPYYSVGTTAGFSAVDVNGSYATLSSGNNLRAATFAGNRSITGFLNDDVQADGSNYPDNSFGNADEGELKLEVNGVIVHVVDLSSFTGTGDPGSGTATSLTNGSGFNYLSIAGAGTLANGTSFPNFKHRTGKYIVDPVHQRNGWNYCKVLHVINQISYTTNYIEWVNDSNSDALSASSNSLIFSGGGITNLSGVKYYTDGSATYSVTINNAYKNVYDTNNITFTTSTAGSLNSNVSFSLLDQSKPTINIAGGEDHTKSLSISATDSSLSPDYMINGSITAGVNVTHPLKSNLSNAGQSTASGLLMYNLSDTSTTTSETFRQETYRLLSGSYNSQSDVTNLSNSWDSEIHMTGSNDGYDDGLQFYNQKLYSPLQTFNGGNFTSLANSPASQPDYSSETGIRTFYRWFKNTTGSTRYDFSLEIQGSGTTIVSSDTSLDSGKIKVFIKFPNNGTRSTGWLDLAKEFVLDEYNDNDGAHISDGTISFDLTLNATNYITLGTVGVLNNEYIVVKIEADASWTGNISYMSVTFGVGTGLVGIIPDLDDIENTSLGVTSNLSFGSSKSITGYNDVGTTAGFSATNINQPYTFLSSNNNIRLGTFDGTTSIEGVLNEDVVGSSLAYVNNSFSDANSGSLVLEVNGIDIHEVELTGSYNEIGSGEPGSGTGTSFTGNSGFFDLSVWRPSKFSNYIPRYLETYRTGKFRVHPNDQDDGWNYARVKHVGSWGTRYTNYIEWVNDSESQNDNITSTDSISQFGDDEFYYSSGIKFFINPTGSIYNDVENVYKNIYSADSRAIQLFPTNGSAVSIIQKGNGLSSTKTTNSSLDGYQTLSTLTDSQNETLEIEAIIQFNQSKSLSGSFTSITGTGLYSSGGRLSYVHPIKTAYTSSLVTTSNLLVYSASDNSNKNTIEYFNGEQFRLQRNNYDGQDAVTNNGNKWDSEITINDNDNYSSYATGLIVYDTLLISPLSAGDAGSFRNKHELSNSGVFEGPDNNVDYSSLFWSERDYFRGFLNNTTNDRPSITVTLYGDAIIVGKSGANYAALGANKNINVEIKIPDKTGFLDLGKPSAGSGNISDGDGCLSGDLSGTILTSGTSNICTFNGQTVDGTVSGAEYIVLVISAHKDWTGYLSRIDIAWST